MNQNSKGKNLGGFHTEYLHKRNNEERRHRSRCIHRKSIDNFCTYYYRKCFGSVHCEAYKE